MINPSVPHIINVLICIICIDDFWLRQKLKEFVPSSGSNLSRAFILNLSGIELKSLSLMSWLSLSAL